MLGILSIPLFRWLKKNCPLHFIKKLSTLQNYSAAESKLEKSIETVHVLVVETKCIQILNQLVYNSF